MIKAKCDLGHEFYIPEDREKEQASNCPSCGLITWNPAKPKREKIVAGNLGVVGDTDRWNPWCPSLGELDPSKKRQRIAEGSIRKNPKTGNWEGYAETHQEYKRLLNESGGINGWGEGKIDEKKQGWDPKYRR